MRLNVFGTTITTQNEHHKNIEYGFTLHEDVSNNKAYVSIYDDENLNAESITDYTKISDNTASPTKHNFSETKITLPNAGALNADEILTLAITDSTIFARKTEDESGNNISIDRILEYSVAPTGTCFNKTAIFCKIKQYALQDVNNDYIYDSNDELIIPEDAWL